MVLGTFVSKLSQNLGFSHSEKSLPLIVSKHFYEKSALRISQLLHMNVNDYKGKKRTRRFFRKKCQFGDRAYFVSKLGQNRCFSHFTRKRLCSFRIFRQISSISTTFLLTPIAGKIIPSFQRPFQVKILGVFKNKIFKNRNFSNKIFFDFSIFFVLS